MQSKIKRANEERELDVDEIRQKMINDKNDLEEKIIKDKQALRDMFDSEQLGKIRIICFFFYIKNH